MAVLVKAKAIEKNLPIYAVEKNCILSKMGDITCAFRVVLPEIFSMSNQDYESLHQTIIKAFRVLPKHTVVHKQDWFVEEKYKASFEKDLTMLDRSSERHFNERPFLNHYCYLYITKKVPTRLKSTSLYSTISKNNIVPKESTNKELVSDFLDSVSQFTRILSDTGSIRFFELKDEDIAGTKDKAGIIEKYLTLSPDDQLPCLEDLDFTDGLKIGNKYCNLFTMSDPLDLPAYCGSRTSYDKLSTDKTKFSLGFASPLGLLLTCNHIYNQYIIIEDPAKTQRELETKSKNLQSFMAASRENAIAKIATDEYLNEAIGKQRLMVKAHYNILVWSERKEDLKEIRNLTSSAISQLDGTPRLETLSLGPIFWAGIPGNAADLPSEDTFDTFVEQASCFWNLETNYLSSLSPCWIKMIDRLSGKPVHVDLSDEPMKKGIITNRNKFILGPSGSGKSFFTNHMVRHYYEQGTHVVLVDVGHSYKGLCELVGGYYFTYEESNPIKFNPFYLGEGDILDTEKKESIKTLLQALWKKDDESSTRAEYVGLSNAITKYFEMLDVCPEVFPCFDSFYEFVEGPFRQLLGEQGVREQDFDIKNFLYVLRPYYNGGEFDYLLNSNQNLDLLKQPFIVFELDNIKDHPILFPVVTIIIMEVFISKMRKLKGVRKMILIEEAWKAIAKEGMAEYIKYLFKTVRKFFGEAIVVTQEVEDIISSPVVKNTIVSNSDCKILLDQRKYMNKFDQIQDLLGLTEKEKQLVLSINQNLDPKRRYKEVFFSLGGVQSKVYGTEVSPEEYLAYTTEQTEKTKLYKLQEKWNGDMNLAIREYANELRAS